MNRATARSFKTNTLMVMLEDYDYQLSNALNDETTSRLQLQGLYRAIEGIEYTLESRGCKLPRLKTIQPQTPKETINTTKSTYFDTSDILK